jgi:hypothetical protein
MISSAVGFSVYESPVDGSKTKPVSLMARLFLIFIAMELVVERHVYSTFRISDFFI